MSTRIRELAEGVVAGNRRSLARAITLTESTRSEDAAHAQELLKTLLPHSGRGVRIGISGVPGAGKSTFIESFGLYLVEQGRRVAVLAVDPSSSISGGSILGDKTRMQKLSQAEQAYIRPSPSSGIAGGVNRRTREAMLVCEAAGYDTVLVETVGVGQSEIEVASMTDFFMLIMLPNAGDELQGIKKGILELADCLVVNKIDTDKAAAGRTASQLKTALHFMRPRTPDWTIPILMCSALENLGLPKVLESIEEFGRVTKSESPDGVFNTRRRNQNRDWMWSLAREAILKSFQEHPEVRARWPVLEQEVKDGSTTAVLAAEELVELFGRKG